MGISRNILLVALLIVLPFTLAITCRNCKDYCGACPYGYKYSETCHFDVCAKAPGQYCNLIDELDQLCAEGYVCLRNRCQSSPSVFHI